MSKFMGMVEVDKLLHFGLSGMLFLLFTAISHNLFWGAFWAIIVGLIKELADFYIKGWASVRDIIANLIGIAWAMLCVIAI